MLLLGFLGDEEFNGQEKQWMQKGTLR